MTAPKRRWFRIAKWTPVVAVTTIGVCGGAWQLLLSNLGARSFFADIAEFKQMPAADSGLGVWLWPAPRKVFHMA